MSQRLKILNIVGARPNLPKIAPLMKNKAGRIPPLWDGHAAQRIVEILLKVVPRGKAS
jgi:UDP-N-acetylglucosamine 2-epimerase